MDASVLETVMQIVVGASVIIAGNNIRKKSKPGEFKKRLFNGDTDTLNTGADTASLAVPAILLTQTESSKRIDTLEAMINRLEKTLSDKIDEMGNRLRSMVDSVLITNAKEKPVILQRFEKLEGRMQKTEDAVLRLETRTQKTDDSLQKISDDITRLIAMMETPPKLGTSEMQPPQELVS